MSLFKDTALKTAFGERASIPAFVYIEGTATYGVVPSNFRQYSSSGGSNTTFEGTISWYEDL